MTEQTQVVPQVGMGVTYGVGSDRYAGTITRVTASGKTFWWKMDDYKLIEGNGMSEQQVYEYSPRENAQERVARALRNGKGFQSNGCRIGVGFRRTYLDPSF
jgi:hypothetical protein